MPFPLSVLAVAALAVLAAALATRVLAHRARPALPGPSASAPCRAEADAETEAEALRAALGALPQLVWTLDATGALAWANAAYLALAERLPWDGTADGPASGQGVLGPPLPFVPLEPEAGSSEPGSSEPGRGERAGRLASLRLPGWAEPRWFEVATASLAEGTLWVAADAGPRVVAEAAARAAENALAGVLGQVGGGLAVFDQQGRLARFNPALADLTGLPPSFLRGKPSARAVLDRLRDARLLPEPANHAAWRDEVAALEAAAARGDLSKSWTLPGGRAWRVAGRPYPGGFTAFLFEDVSDEVALSRRVRAEREAAQGVLDSLDEAVAVFTAAGTLALSNAPYAALWGRPAGAPDTGPGDVGPGNVGPGNVSLGDAPLSDPGLGHELARWRRRAPSPFWDRLAAPAPAAARAVLDLGGGDRLACRVAPLAGGATLVRFRPLAAAGDGEAATAEAAAAAKAC